MENEVMCLLVDDVEKGTTLLDDVKNHLNTAFSQ